MKSPGENIVFGLAGIVSVCGRAIAADIPVVEPFAAIDLNRCDQLAISYAVFVDPQIDDRITCTGQISFWLADVASQVGFGDLQGIGFPVACRDAVAPTCTGHFGQPQEVAAVVDLDRRAFFIASMEQQGVAVRVPCSQ